MNVVELKTALDKAGVKPHYYSLQGLKGGPYDGTAIIEKDGNRWMYYNYERGSQHGLQYFNTENEVCEYLYQLLVSDPTTRIYNPPNNQ
jgi:hypothetical protein